MNSFITFTKKELVEQIRTYKLFIFLAVFFIFGMTSSLFAKLMPNIIASMDLKGIEIKIPEPTFLDAYAQFFKNVNEMGLIALILIFSGTLSGELTKGTLINMLSKGLSRKVVILSKFTSAILIWTLAYVISILINYGYTFYLFGKHSVDNLLLAFFCLWLFGVFIIAIIILSSTIVKGSYGGLILTAIIYGALMLINLFPKVEKYNPYSLITKNIELINNKISVEDINITMVVTVLMIFVSLVGALKIFRKKQL